MAVRVVALDVGRGGVDGDTTSSRRQKGGGGVGVEEVVLPLLFFAHAGLDTALAGTSKADLKRTWLQQCSAALSPRGTLLAVAREHWMLFLFPSTTQSHDASKDHDDDSADSADEGDTTAAKPDFSFIEVDAQCQTEHGVRETITCLEFVSLVVAQGDHGGLRQSLAVGYSSGRLRFFNEAGSLLMTQQLHLAPVRRLRLRAGASMYGHALVGEQNEDLAVVFGDGVVATIDGLSLYSALRACFFYADLRKSRGAAEVAASTLDYGKWELVGTEEVHDVATCGLVAPSLAATLASDGPLGGPGGGGGGGGFGGGGAAGGGDAYDDGYDGGGSGATTTTTTAASVPGRTRQLLVVGKHPMVAFYQVEEQFMSFTTAVSLASTVATKLTSAVFSLARTWWGGAAAANKEEEAEPPKQTETPVTLSFNSYLSDAKRQVGGIALDPMGHYAALTDNLARVLLLDVPRRQLLRMWKGYREAQCAWLWAEPPPLPATPTSSSSRAGSPRGASRNSFTSGSSSTASASSPTGASRAHSPAMTPIKAGEGTLPLYLVIYAPRRGVLEVWHVRHGSRVGILDVGMEGRLLAPPCPLGAPSFTASSTTTSGVPGSAAARSPAFPPRCFFLAADGRLLQITLRFT